MKNLKPQPELPTPALHQWYPILVQLPLTSTSIYQQTLETKTPPMVMKKNMKKKNFPQQHPSHPTPQTPTTTQNILLCTNTCIVNSSILPLHGTTYKLCVARAILLERKDDVERRRRRRRRRRGVALHPPRKKNRSVFQQTRRMMRMIMGSETTCMDVRMYLRWTCIHVPAWYRICGFLYRNY